MSKAVKVHFRSPDGSYLCGVGRRWSSQQLTSVRVKGGVTCRSCIRLIAKREDWCRLVTYHMPPDEYSPPTRCEQCLVVIYYGPVIGGSRWSHLAQGRPGYSPIDHEVVMRPEGWWDTKTGRTVYGSLSEELRLAIERGNMNKPFVGMIVLAKSTANGSTCAPAIVTRVWQEEPPSVVDLAVMLVQSSSKHQCTCTALRTRHGMFRSARMPVGAFLRR